jgi:hypothetical protein
LTETPKKLWFAATLRYTPTPVPGSGIEMISE